ncbi:MAG: SH3 domain-containing protein [Bacteriovoracia bacterium]
MIKLISIFLFLSVVANGAAKDKHLGVQYVDQFMGHVYQLPSISSESVTTVACGHPLKIKDIKRNEGVQWFKVKIGPETGYIKTIHVSVKKPTCFQKEYPKFYNALNLDLTQLYYWGKLQDQYLKGHSKVK